MSECMKLRTEDNMRLSSRTNFDETILWCDKIRGFKNENLLLTVKPNR